MDESQLLQLIRRRVPLIKPSPLILGIGDDCAVFRPPGSKTDWLITTDMLIEDVHFRRDGHPARSIGHRVLARGLSDIAAMGGEPRFALLSLALAEWTKTRWVNDFFRGFGALAERTRVALAGGDLARSAKLSCDVVVCGEAPRDAALRRDGARPGDRICVSGLLGGSALGLRTQRGAAWRRHLYPEPRLALGRFLQRRLKATAAMDLSDGLSLDLQRLALASGVSAVLDCEPPRCMAVRTTNSCSRCLRAPNCPPSTRASRSPASAPSNEASRAVSSSWAGRLRRAVTTISATIRVDWARSVDAGIAPY